MVTLPRLEALNNEDVTKDDDDEDMDDMNEGGSESEDGEGVPLAEPAKNAIYNKEGLLEKLEDIAWRDDVEWIHKLTVDHEQAEKVDVNDDLTRELAFYTQALDGARQAFEKLQSMKVRFLRPPDYYAEMVKTDSHMMKVKGNLLAEKKKIEEAEERKKARESKKVAKEVQAQKAKEKAKEKKDSIESVKKWRKQRQQSGFAKGKDDELDMDFDGEKAFEKSKKKRPGVAPGDRTGGFARRGGKKGPKGRERRDSKFGFGGRKAGSKQNSSETTNDLRGFNGGQFSKDRKRKR